MEIPFGKYLIVSDANNIILREVKIVSADSPRTKEENIGNEYYTDIAFFSTIDGLLRGLCEISIRESKATSFQELVIEVKELKETLKSLKDLFNPA